MPEVLSALNAFLQEHSRCGELDGGGDDVQETWGTIPSGPLNREYFADCMRVHGYTGRLPQPGESPSPTR